MSSTWSRRRPIQQFELDGGFRKSCSLLQTMWLRPVKKTNCLCCWCLHTRTLLWHIRTRNSHDSKSDGCLQLWSKLWAWCLHSVWWTRGGLLGASPRPDGRRSGHPAGWNHIWLCECQGIPSEAEDGAEADPESYRSDPCWFLSPCPAVPELPACQEHVLQINNIADKQSIFPWGNLIVKEKTNGHFHFILIQKHDWILQDQKNLTSCTSHIDF